MLLVSFSLHHFRLLTCRKKEQKQWGQKWAQIGKLQVLIMKIVAITHISTLQLSPHESAAKNI